MSKDKRSLLKLLTKFAFLFPYIMIVVREILSLFKLEARMAAQNFCKIIIFSVLFGGLLFSLWMGMLVLLALYLVQQHWSLSEALMVVLGVNTLVLVLVGFLINAARKKLSFSETRKQLFKNRKVPE